MATVTPRSRRPRAGRSVIDLVEAAYSLDGDDSSWLGRIGETARVELDLGQGIVCLATGRGDGELAALATVGVAIAPDEVRERLANPAVRYFWADLSRTAATVSTGAALLSRKNPGSGALFDQIGRRYGTYDVWGLVARDGEGGSVQIAAPSPRPLAPLQRRAPRWERVAAHIGAAWRLRRRLAAGAREPAAILTPDGRLLEADADLAPRPRLRERLVRAVADLERARGPRQRRDADGGLELWRGLVAGRFSLIDSFERSGRRLLVAHENPIERPDPRALTPRERAVIALAATAQSNKAIAYALGVASGTVARTLSEALAKLGLRRRSDVVHLLDGAERARVSVSGAELEVLVGPAPRADLGQGLSPTERELVALLARGASNRAIAQVRGTSERTVANQLASLYRKLSVGSRSELLLRVRT